MFGKEVYIARRRALLEKMRGEKGVILFLGNVEAPAQYRDNCYKWRQDSTWLYFFGIDEPRFAATVDLESGDETLYADDFGIDDIIWMGPMPTVRSLADAAGVQKTASYGALGAALKGRKVHFVPASRYATALSLGSLLGIDPMTAFSVGKKGCPAASAPLVDAVISLRLVKEPCEIEEIEKACEIGYRMHSVARDGIRPGRVEQEIVGEMEGVTLSEGWGVSFATILTQHGEIFHCHSHDCIIEPGRLMVIDAGAENNMHYASDFTRTYPTGGKFTSRQRDVYTIVYECNEYAYGLVRPGHGLGHNMGLDVHDMEDYGEDLVGYDAGQSRSPQLGLGSLRMARRLQEGNVITDEPGIYFIPDLIRAWKAEGRCRDFVDYGRLEAYFDFGGIRLEDDLLVTSGGARRLGSRRLPIAPDEVEESMKQY